MTVEGWRASIEELVGEVNTRGSEPYYQRELLFGLWLLFERAPHQIHREFEKLSEAQLSAAGAVMSAQLISEEPFVCPVSPAILYDTVTFAAGLLRALERALLDLGGRVVEPRSAQDLRVQYKDEAGYVLPYAPFFREPNQGWPNYFGRRGLTRSRCIPEILSDNHRVTLVLAPPFPKGGVVTCATQIFEGVTPLDAANQPIDFSAVGAFIFHGVTLKPAELEAGLTECLSSDEEPDIVVFPELTMPPEKRAELRHLLRQKPWDPGLTRIPPRIVVGGSWHDPNGAGGFENRSPIMDGDGETRAWHRKHMPFTRDELVENIQPSDEILVIATPNLILAIAICLDFCDEGSLRNPYDELDVDLVLVTSMGADATMEAHETEAKRLWHRRKAATFVSQQSDSGQFGYVASIPHSEGEPVSERVLNRLSMRRLYGKA